MSDISVQQGSGPDSNGLVREYMDRAARALDLGEDMLGLHLYLAAYGQAAGDASAPSGPAMDALKEAWRLALSLKERSLAEYIFEKMEPALSPAEVKDCSGSLQSLAFDKLEQMGISRTDLEEVSAAISQELHGETGPSTVAATDMSLSLGLPGVGDSGFPAVIGGPSLPLPPVGISVPKADASLTASRDSKPEKPKEGSLPAISATVTLPKVLPEIPIAEEEPPFTYADLAGYANAIRDAKALGVGRAKDPNYAKLVRDLNAAHGVADPPGCDPILITAPVREDAVRFAFATVGELGLPLFRMYVEDNPQGLQALCVYAQNTPHFKYDRRLGAFEGKGILFLEDIDLWEVPSVPDCEEAGMNPLIQAQINKSLREVYNFIRAGVDDPNVTVLVTAAKDAEISPFFTQILEPVQTVAIDMPTAGERASIWMQLVNQHPSLSGMSVAVLVKNSANMARYDIYGAVADVLDETYKADLGRGKASKVNPARLFERLAAYQPLDSEEYHTLEEAIVSDFRAGLSHLDELLD